MKRILIPLPETDFDITEVCIPWRLFTDRGYKIVFASESGQIAQTHKMLITGEIFGELGDKVKAINSYREMIKSDEFMHPILFGNINVREFDMVHLPGGYAKGMRDYVGNKILQEKVAGFIKLNKIVGSIGHGGVLLVRSIDQSTGKCVVHSKKMTALTNSLQRTVYHSSAWKLGDYFSTIPETVEDEVCRNLSDKRNFITGNPSQQLVIEDGNLVTARWPFDACLYVETLIKKIEKS
jgi:putative intracellular protease/amidase